MDFTDLAKDYLAAVDECLSMFEKKFGRRDLVRAWREQVIPQTGELVEGVEYQMHGFGCAVEFADHDVDFDFASQFDIGFDAWRLWIYAEQFPKLYPAYQDKKAVEASLAEALAAGSIRPLACPYPGEGNSKLFELSGN